MLASFSIATASPPSHIRFSSLPRTTLPQSSSTISPFPRKFTRRNPLGLSIRVQTLDFADTFFEGGLDLDDDSPSFGGPFIPETDEEKEEIPCPPGLRQYETMIVLIPDLSEEERLAVTQKYEELLVAGGGMYVEIFNRGVIPLAYCIKKRNKAGEINNYMDGVYLLYTYFTKPDSVKELEEALQIDYNVIRKATVKIRKRRVIMCSVYKKYKKEGEKNLNGATLRKLGAAVKNLLKSRDQTAISETYGLFWNF